MPASTAYSAIQAGQLQMPAAALDILPQNTPLFLFIDGEKGIVTIHAQGPADLPNKEIRAESAALFADVDWRSHTEPPPPESLRHPSKEKNAGQCEVIDLMLTITAVDDKIWALQRDLDEKGAEAWHSEEEQVRYMTLAAKLKQAYLAALGTPSELPAYETLVRAGVPGRP